MDENSWGEMEKMSNNKINYGCQTIYSEAGKILFSGLWDSRQLFKAVTGPEGDNYWLGRRVLDIGANSSGLSVEIARRGASVVAIEPDPYQNVRAPAEEILNRLIEKENLSLELRSDSIFDAHNLGKFDTVLCLGLVYHFRDQQFIIDYLSTLDMKDLVISNQTSSGDGLVMVNRMDVSVPCPESFWATYTDALSGWHPTRPMFERMLYYAGFDDVLPLTDPTINFPHKPLPGITNSSYYRAQKARSVEPIASRYVYLPR